MDGIEKITGRIAADTEAEIAAIRAEARRQADEITARYEAQAKREAEEIAARGRRSAEERQARLASVAQLDARKLELAAKQEMLAKAYDRAMERLTSLPDEEYVGLLAGLAAEASSTGREEYTMKEDEDKIPRIGVSAQAVREVLPEAVQLITPDNGDSYYGVDYIQMLTAFGINGIKELYAKVKALEKRVEELENR